MPTNKNIIEEIKELASQLDGGEINTLTCYDPKKEWKKIEIIHDIKDRT